MRKTNIYLYPLEGKVVFPYHQYSFSISSNAYAPEAHDNLIGFVTRITAPNSYVETIEGLSRFGTLLKIHKSDASAYRTFDRSKPFTVNYLGLTFARFRIVSLSGGEGRLAGTIQIYTDEVSKETEVALEKRALLTNLKKELKFYYECTLRYVESQLKKQALEQESSINKILYRTADELDLSAMDKILFLQLHKHEAKAEFLVGRLTERTENMKGVVNIQDKVRQEMYRTNQTKKRTIDMRGETGEIQDKIAQKRLPESVKQEIQKELKRMGGDSQKAVTLKYIQTLLEIPWMDSTQDVRDLALAERVLQQDHTGLKQVKERILEFLAVRFRNGNSKGNILCLHGPPGVGKTSIAKSIARALGRQFTRVSLGGLNDQAELRGHRRTYVAALPGVIVRALIKAKVNNPVILLDEIEKMGRSHKGDPEHVLLQILDPSQNFSFVDHYVGLPIDLSRVLFICTANSLELSTPLLNRLELLHVPGYTREEKLEIVKNHLLSLQLKQNGVEGLLEFEEDALVEIVKYSQELGVRQLERKIAKICRRVARKGEKQRVSRQRVRQILGEREQGERWEGVGVVNGLAWTQMGGKVLTVEAVQYRSKQQKIEVTGQLGEVMRESVQIAFSWIKANIQELAVLGNLGQQLTALEKLQHLEKASLHVHFPQGATKKDGPSAGVTIVTCLASLLLRTPVRSGLAMTGQITLSGKVLPVGGVRQKCLAAIYDGIKHIIIPHENLKDLDNLEPQLRKKAQFYPVKDLREVLAVAFASQYEKVPPKI